MNPTAIGRVGDLALKLGGTLKDAALAYVTYGTLAPDGRNAILLTHGYTSSHLFAHRPDSADKPGADKGAAEGSWAALVGPGAAIDTDRYFVVSSNMLGSSYGSTGPATPDPATGKPYGPSFPELTLADMVTAQRRLLDRLGVRELIAVVGPSYGGFQAFAWGVEFPGFARGIAPVVSAPKARADSDPQGLERRLAGDPNWNGGWYYDKGGIAPTMAGLRAETLRRYGVEASLAARLPDKAARDAEIKRQAEAWAAEFDGHSLLALGRCSRRFDATPDLARITAKVLYVLSSTDFLFPPTLAPGVMAALARAGVDARYHLLESPHGHLASGTDALKWAPALREFLRALD